MSLPTTTQPVKVPFGGPCDGMSMQDLQGFRGRFPGALLQLESEATRTSITLAYKGHRLAWFRKKDWDVPAGLSLHNFYGQVSGDPRDPFILIWLKDNVSLPQTSNAQKAVSAALEEAREACKTQPQKETAMTTYAQQFTNVINANKAAAATAGYMEAGRIANRQAVKLASKHLPLMVRGYADTALGKLVIANIASIAVKQLRPNDPTLNQLTEAMTVQAFQDILQSFDIDGFIDGLLTSDEMKAAVSKLPATGGKA